MSEKRIKTGDTVFHAKSGEEWVVAYADYNSGELAWCGWPPGWARIEDCELTESCTAERSEALLQDMLNINDKSDHRSRWARRVMRERSAS